MQSGASFLHDKNPDFHASQEVTAVTDYLRAHGEAIPNQPDVKIAAYLGFLADKDYVNDGVQTGNQASMERQIEAASVDLTPENAHAYVKFQARVAREQGYGDVIDPETMDDKEKLHMLRLVRADQQGQLTEWVQELNSDENHYPEWFKHWMFENVKRHTTFNEDLGKNGQPKGYEKRSASSFVLFPELDRQSVSLVFDALTEKLGGDPMGFEYDNMRKLLGKANFAELYAEAQNYGFKITDTLKAVMTGSWRDFHQSDRKADAEALSALVKSYRTGWCTAGVETAAVQLQGGDFYVWCSTNPETGQDEVPRIAVRMENGSIAEVRGIIGGRKQELEPELMDVVMGKIKDLPGGEEYFQKAENMKRVTMLEKLLVANPDAELTTEQVRFLYEFDGPIIGFGYGNYGGFGRDPRVDELRALRGERDLPPLKELAVEYVRESFEAAFAGYDSLVSELNALRGDQHQPAKRRFGHRRTAVEQAATDTLPVLSREQVAALYETKLAEWQRDGVLDYVAERIASHGEKHLPVLRPNTVVVPGELKALAHNFAKGQGFSEAYVDHALYDSYESPEELAILSGFDPDAGPLHFSLLPNKFSDELGYAPVEDQRQTLQRLQAAQPKLRIRVPSLLDGQSLWRTLRAQGDRLNSGNVWDRTGIRHLDLEPKRLGRWLFVPRSIVDRGAEPGLDGSDAEGGYDARVAVG